MDHKTVTIPRWFDRHLHVRDGDMMKLVLPSTLRQRVTGALIMPNLQPDPITTFERALAYRKRILSALPPGSDFQARMTLYLTDETRPEDVVEGFKQGAWCAVKLYTADQNGKGGTTGSSHGVRNLRGRYPVFEAMEREGIPLLGHFEAVESEFDEFEREIRSFDRDVLPLLRTFPALRVVVEHITDSRSADYVAQIENDNIRATVTAHHLMLNRNALFEGGLNPGLYCRPVLKADVHRRGVRKWVTSGSPRFGAGTDSAPHDESTKSRCYGCAAGIFTAETAAQLYATVFDQDNALQHLGNFMSVNFLEFYGMEVSKEMVVLERVPMEVPDKVGSVQVFKGGTSLPWRFAE